MSIEAAAIEPATPLRPTIKRLRVERFRGIEALTWLPGAGLNVVLGGGDVGKTTILDAIALLLSPTNTSSLSDTDFYLRDEDAGFLIEATITLPDTSRIGKQMKPAWPWAWNGTEAVVPAVDDDAAVEHAPVYCLRVRGTQDLELVYEVVQPDGTADALSVALRRAIGLVRLSGDDRNDRDLRLVHGSALDRLISDKNLRARLTTELAKQSVQAELTEAARSALADLDGAFKARDLPSGLDLAITGSQGVAITALIGLTALRSAVHLPLNSWGSGTRRLAALAIAEQNQAGSPITIVDEVERGLEPYRQRALVEKLQEGTSQVFLTTHSPPVIAAASDATIWYVDHAGSIGALDAKKIARHRARDPEAFFSRVTIVAEGVTEVGFVSALLERSLGGALRGHGIHVSDGGGNEAALDLLEALSQGGLMFGGFADDEGDQHAGRWQKVQERLGILLFRWPTGCLEENFVRALPAAKLEALVVDPSHEKTGVRLRTLVDRLKIQERTFAAISAAAGDTLRHVVLEAALGKVPADIVEPGEKKTHKNHAQQWFKTESGGRELAEKLLTLDVWPAFKGHLMPFLNAVRLSVGLSAHEDLP